jgi:basic membrane protein A
MKNKIKLTLLVSVLLLSLVSCSKKADTLATTEVNTEKQWKIAFISGGLFGDQGMNDAMLSSIESFTKESGIEVTSVEVSQSTDTMINLTNFAEKKYDIVLLGSNFSDVIKEKSDIYTDTVFIINKGSINEDNVISIQFNEPDGAFLAGAYAALQTKLLGGKPVVGWVGGMRIPDLEISKYAFMAGAKAFGADTNTVYIGNFQDSAKSKEMALQMYNDGISIIQSFCGGAASGVYQAAEAQDDKHFAMGSATGQFYMSDKIVASQVVNYDKYFDKVLLNYIENEGSVNSELLVGTLTNNGVGIKYAPTHGDMATTEIRNKIDLLKEAVVSGQIIVPTNEETFNNFTYSEK